NWLWRRKSHRAQFRSRANIRQGYSGRLSSLPYSSCWDYWCGSCAFSLKAELESDIHRRDAENSQPAPRLRRPRVFGSDIYNRRSIFLKLRPKCGAQFSKRFHGERNACGIEQRRSVNGIADDVEPFVIAYPKQTGDDDTKVYLRIEPAFPA